MCFYNTTLHLQRAPEKKEKKLVQRKKRYQKHMQKKLISLSNQGIMNMKLKSTLLSWTCNVHSTIQYHYHNCLYCNWIWGLQVHIYMYVLELTITHYTTLGHQATQECKNEYSLSHTMQYALLCKNREKLLFIHTLNMLSYLVATSYQRYPKLT